MEKNRTSPPKRDMYQEVTNRILELLDQGVAPWRQLIKPPADDRAVSSLDRRLAKKAQGR